MVELDDIRKGNYFQLGKGLCEISLEDYPFLHELSRDLIPLSINSQRLHRLGFESIPGSRMNRWQKASSYGKLMFLKAGVKNQWIIQFGEDEKVRIIDYIHELQNIYYWLFGEPLQRPQKKEREVLKPKHQIISDFILENKRPQHFAVQIQPFYLSWDCMFLMCTKPYIIWQIVDDNPLFEYGGKKWGVKLLSGQASNYHDDQAVHFLREYVKTIPTFN
jgi:hypothetical protein